MLIFFFLLDIFLRLVYLVIALVIFRHRREWANDLREFQRNNFGRPLWSKRVAIAFDEAAAAIFAALTIYPLVRIPYDPYSLW